MFTESITNIAETIVHLSEGFTRKHSVTAIFDPFLKYSTGEKTHYQ